MRSKTKFIVIVFLVGIFASCNRIPDYVIKPDKMASLMADIRMADAIVSVRNEEYNTDAKKLALKNAVLDCHGVTSEQFDTSLIWYGRNIGEYQEVTKRSIEILEKRLKETSAIAAGETAMSVSGDSVDIWGGTRVYAITHRSPTQYIAFDFESDPNWEQGDIYTLRSRLISPIQYAQWNLTAMYDDGAIETISSNIALDNPARQEITLITDSTRTTVRISGWINIEPLPGRTAIVDSLSLMRRRTSPELARTKKYSQKLIAPRKDDQPQDTLSTGIFKVPGEVVGLKPN